MKEILYIIKIIKCSNKMGRIVNLKVNCINKRLGGTQKASKSKASEPQSNNWGHTDLNLFIKIVK